MLARVLLVFGATLAACGSPAPPSPRDDGGVPADGGAATGPLALLRACTDDLTEVYRTPAGLPSFSPAERGAVVRCATDLPVSPEALAARLAAAGVVGISPRGSASSYRIAYRTDRGDGRAGLGTARVLLPDDPAPGALPIIVATHGTSGLADLCAVSRYETASDYLILPWVARGYPVVAPDYAGLGTEGVQGYGDNRDTAASTLDAARALRRLLRPGRLSPRVVVAGHSQGGGAALAAQALGRSYGVDGEVAAVVGFAPGWAFRVDADALRFPNLPTTAAGGVPAAVAALALYAYHANRFGPEHAGDGFPPAVRAALVAAIDTQCIFQLAGSVPTLAPTVGQLVEERLRTTFVACAGGAACEEPGKSYYEYARANVVPSDPEGGAVLVLQGMLDATATPARAACLVEKMRSDGVTPTVCTYADAQHLDIVQKSMGFAVAWVEALLAGAPLPPCAASALPACAP